MSDQELIQKFSTLSPEEQAQFIEALKQEQKAIGQPVQDAIRSWMHVVHQSTQDLEPKQREADLEESFRDTENFFQWLRSMRVYKVPRTPGPTTKEEIDALVNNHEAHRYIDMLTQTTYEFWPWFAKTPLLQLLTPEAVQYVDTTWILRKSNGIYNIVTRKEPYKAAAQWQLHERN